MADKIFHRFVHSVLFILSLLSKTTTSTSHYKCINKERDALLDFKAHVQDNDDRLSTWNLENEEDAECCDWDGVTRNKQTGHVTRLDLTFFGLEGKMSPSLLSLSHLTYLDLRWNSFSGTILMFIGSMTKLRHLDLSYNSFSGTIPKSIGSLTELTDLDLSGNHLINGSCIPQELGNLTNLQYLSLNFLQSCTIENIDWLSQMTNLEYLFMDGISLAKANNWINVITSLQKLSALSLESCELSEVMHPYSSSFRNSNVSSIVTLNLRDNNLNSSAYLWLSPLASNKLFLLDISCNVLDGIPFDNICSLGTLNFSHNPIVINFPDFLNSWSGCSSVALQNLYASCSRFTGSLSDEIQMFSNLRYLELDHNELDGAISEKVWELPKLKTLIISSNYLRNAISENIGTSKVTYIDLSNNSIKGVLPKAHMSNLSYVQSIHLSFCNLGPHFPKWILNLKNLVDLDISNNRISETTSMELRKTWSSHFIYMNLSSNNISGEVQDLLSRFDPNEESRIDLSSNNFYGSILNVPPNSSYVDLSRNKFHGGLSFLCQFNNGSLGYLDLSHNSFTGNLPDCLWHLLDLRVLHLGYNNLFGRIPSSVEYLIDLEVLSLYNNLFSEELPSSLKIARR